MAHPIGSLLSGPVCDKIGRRKAIMMVTIPLTAAWIMLGFAQSFPLICVGFTIIGFSMGLKEAPSITYVSEISEPSVRGMMSTIAVMSYNFGIFIVLGLGLALSWRQVAWICAIFPFSCLMAVLFVSFCSLLILFLFIFPSFPFLHSLHTFRSNIETFD